MSRISDALARARHADTAPADDDGASWDFGHDRSPASVPTPWDFTNVPEPPPAQPTKAVVSLVRAGEPAPPIARTAPNPAYAEKLIGAAELPAGMVEQYRRLGAALHEAQRQNGIRVLMIASALPAEGKTLVASNLALVLSGSYGRRVLLIDADLRRPSLHHAFGVENTTGIADRLGCEDPGLLPTVPVSPNLDLLLAGAPQSDPMRIVTGNGMRRLLEESSQSYEWVIVDTPPVALLPDAHLLAAMVDRVLLVIEASKTPYDVIQKSIAMIGKERIIGTVLNRVDASTAAPYESTYDHYYGPSSVVR